MSALITQAMVTNRLKTSRCRPTKSPNHWLNCEYVFISGLTSDDYSSYSFKDNNNSLSDCIRPKTEVTDEEEEEDSEEVVVNTIEPIVIPILCLVDDSLSKHIISFILILILNGYPLRHH